MKQAMAASRSRFNDRCLVASSSMAEDRHQLPKSAFLGIISVCVVCSTAGVVLALLGGAVLTKKYLIPAYERFRARGESIDEDITWVPRYDHRGRPSEMICRSAPCQWTVSNVLDRASRLASPCDDFYAHVCSRRLVPRQPIMQMPTSLSAALHLFADIEQFFKRYSSVKAAEGFAPGPDDNFVSQMMWTYNECRKAASEDITLTAELDVIFEKLGLSSWTPQTTLSSLLARGDRLLRLHPLFTVTVKPSHNFSSQGRSDERFSIHMGPPDTLYRRFMLSDLGATKDRFVLIVHNALSWRTTDNISTSNTKPLTSLAMAEKVVAFEKELDGLRIPPRSRSFASNDHSAVTLGDLPPSDSWSWTAYFHTLLPEVETQVDNGTGIFLSDAFLIRNLPPLMNPSWHNTIANYMALKALVDLSPFLGSYFEDLVKLTHSFTADGIKHRQAACMVMLEKLYKYGVGIVVKLTAGREYVTVHRSYQDKQLKKQFRTARRTVKALLSANRSWIDAEAITRARRKLDTLIFNFGARSSLIEYELYRNTHTFAPYSNWSTLAKVFKIHIHASTLYWDAYGSDSPGYDNRYTVSSFWPSYEYQEATNLLFLPPAVVSLLNGVSNAIHPIFYPIVTSHVVRGLLHVVTLFESSVNNETSSASLWKNSSATEYKDVRSCLEHQYNKGHELSLLDFLDNAMTYPLYSMYRDALERQNLSRFILESVGRTHDVRQTFFYVLASSLCDFANATGLERQRNFLVPSARWRINVPLRNFRFFAEAFHCPPNSYMNPSMQCSVWKAPRSLFATNR